MFRFAVRSSPSNPVLPRLARRAPYRDLSSVPPAHRPRSVKSSAARWGIAAAAVYFYNTATPTFAEEPRYSPRLPDTSQEDENLVTVDSISASRRERQAQRLPIPLTPDLDAPSMSSSAESSKAAAAAALSSAYPPSDESSSSSSSVSPDSPLDDPAGAEDLEEEAAGQGAFNEETGEINWDCPCLGGMAHGPCGPEFREAFSCFVFSKDEPKGIDCIDRFKGMQDCFRAHPDVYGAELEDEVADDLDAPGAHQQQPPPAPYSGSSSLQDKMPDSGTAATPSASMPSAAGVTSPTGPVNEGGEKVTLPNKANSDDGRSKTERAKAASEQVSQDHGPTSESGAMVPKAWHDATDKNDGK